MTLNDQVYFIALGGNVPSVHGDCAQTLSAGAARLAELLGSEVTLSPLYETPCFPAGAGPDYVNAAAKVVFRGSPGALLAKLHQVEEEFGRARVQRWGQRTLDLDLLAAGQTILPDAATQAQWRALPPADQQTRAPDQLILPHPRLQDRAFVLVPLADIAPDWVHPLLGLSVREMLARLPQSDLSDMRRLE